MGHEQMGMDLSGTFCGNFGAVPGPEPYKKGKGMIAAYGRGPKGRNCFSCQNFSERHGAESCRVVPWAEVGRRCAACGRYEEKD